MQTMLSLVDPLIGKYRPIRQLANKVGRQTMLAQDTESGQSVVLKVTQFGPTFQWSDLKLHEREGQTLQNLDHPAIPRYLDAFETTIDGIASFVLVQTYIEADSLETAMQSGRHFSETEIIEIADKLLEILAYLHQQHPPIVHRDIKPSNILVTNRSAHSVGEVYLVDFGSVQTTACHKNGTITIVGSYGYIPLEQFVGKAVPSSDLYSLGMTLIYLSSGIHPADLTQDDGKVSIPSNLLRPKFQWWVERMAHPYVEKRFSDASLALNALRHQDHSGCQFFELRPDSSDVEIHRTSEQLTVVVKPAFKLPAIVSTTIGVLGGAVFVSIPLSIPVYIALLILRILGLPESIFTAVSPYICPVMAGIVFILLLAGALRQYDGLSLFEYMRDVFQLDNKHGIRQGICASDTAKVNWKSPGRHLSAEPLLIYNPGCQFDHFYDESRKKELTGKATMLPSLTLSVGKTQYDIGRKGLSSSEFLWIGKEISDFLGIEMQTVYPAPIRPLESSCGGGC